MGSGSERTAESGRLEENVRELDIREIDGPPFDEITSALEAVSNDETLVLVNSFEPEPLYAVIERRGFTYEATKVADDEWRVAIERA